jgi:NAD(P)-dependent dehydrogenase (short-subunit alcohol dehydrogenase family)
MKNRQNTILITGGASGIGRAITEAVLLEGWNAVVVDLNTESLTRCEKELDKSDDRLLCEKLDISDENAVSNFVNKVDKAYHPFTGIVNSAGIGKDIPALDTDITFFRKILEVNLIGSFIVNREVAKLMIPRQKGSIVNIASISGIIGNLGRVAYGASKGGVLNMTKVLAVEWAKSGVRVNAIAPGPIETPLVKKMHTKTTRRAWTKLVPQGRYGSPKEIASAATFLLDNTKSSFINGQTISIDGGLTIGGVINTK